MCDEVLKFLGCQTPLSWVEAAAENLDLLLIDHAHCERKAASTAISLISQYPHEIDLLNTLSRLAREEMRHFETVLQILKARNVVFCRLGAGRYAKGLHKYIRSTGKERLIDSLLIAAIIEARSCERFLALQKVLPTDLQGFYSRLYQAEARHFRTYLELARIISGQNYFLQLETLKEIENNLILEKDSEFRFHSGVPA